MTRGERWKRSGVGALCALFLVGGLALACAAPPPAGPSRAMEAQAVRSKLAAGLSLYESGDYAIAAERFAEAAAGAVRCRDDEMERRARAAECASWLRARRIDDFASCTARLQPVQRRARRSDPGVNTLVALGAIAGQRPAPALRVPDRVAPLLHQVRLNTPTQGGS